MLFDQSVQFKKIYEEEYGQLGGSFRIVRYPEDRKPIDIGDYYADYGAIRELLGWRPTVTLEDGLARSLAYYREHGKLYW